MELKANELRINNLLYDNLGRIIKVSEIREEHIIFYLSNNSKIKHTINSFKPIPLTEEWLLKFGFEKKKWKAKNSIYFELDKIEILLQDSYYKKGVTYFNSNLLFEYFPKYIHQLQNIYFALTNKELKCKTYQLIY